MVAPLTGNPIALSALKLRESLEQVYKLYPKTKDMVLISHSMGGLLSQMQPVTTGRVLWNDVFQGDANRLYAAVPANNLMKRALIFEANPRIQRIVFICVPHRGADLAINWIGSIGVGLIQLPGTIVAQISSVATGTLQKDIGVKHPPTGINGLSPRSPVLRGLDTLPIHAPYHTIVGDRGRGDTPKSSDGVVAYWSSHLTGAESEIIVPGPHGSFASTAFLPCGAQQQSSVWPTLHLVKGPFKAIQGGQLRNAQRKCYAPNWRVPDRFADCGRAGDRVVCPRTGAAGAPFPPVLDTVFFVFRPIIRATCFRAL